MVKPKDGHDPFPAPSFIVYVPALNGGDDDDAGDEAEEESTGSSTPPGTSSPEDSGPRRTSRNPKPVQRLNLFTQEAAQEQIEHALVTCSDFGNLGTGRPGEVGYRPADPANYDEAVSGPEADRWTASVIDEQQSLYDHDVFDWVDAPEGAQLLPAKFHFRWKYNEEHFAVRPKSRVMVQG